MFRYTPFKEIDKNKWNGCVHYSNNSNIQGHHWYLKAVIHEWGAIVENDYETVMPIILNPLKAYQYDLLRELGPYSVNPLNKGRLDEIFRLMDRYQVSSKYPLNSRVSSAYLNDYNLVNKQKSVFHGGKKYTKLSDSYSDAFLDDLYGEGFEEVKIMSGKKPEEIVSLLKICNDYKNALMRLMYNAIHRGIGFSNGLEDKKTGEVLAISFFVGTPSSITELISYSPGPKKYRQLIFDLILRKNAERPITIETFQNINDLHELGFDSELVGDILFEKSRMLNIRRALGISH